MNNKRYFVTAIGTDSGKTLFSAILVEALKADYWKPVQAGFPRDTETVQSLVSNKISRFHPEGYLLNTPASPHAAAKIDHVRIEAKKIEVPQTDNHLIIEGAGGALVPLNDDELVIDLPRQSDMEIILVSNLYLGSINHTLLTVEALKSRKLKVRGLVFNGPENRESEQIIRQKSGYQLLMNLRDQEVINPKVVLSLAEELRTHLQE